MRHSLPPKNNDELADELMARFPTVDHAELLREITGLQFFYMRHGNKREERAACDYLNDLQRMADRIVARNTNKQEDK